MTGIDLDDVSRFSAAGDGLHQQPIHGDYSPVAEAEAILAESADRDLVLA